MVMKNVQRSDTRRTATCSIQPHNSDLPKPIHQQLANRKLLWVDTRISSILES
jgi:hypothetical protein